MAIFLNESFIISRTLSQIGYSGYMRTIRQNACNCMESSWNREQPFQFIFSGSKAEGLSAIHENDVDVMSIPLNTVCSEYPVGYFTGEQINIFQLSKRNTAPGYVILKLPQSFNSDFDPVSDLIKDSLVELIPGQVYLSSDIWKHTLKQHYIEVCLQRGNVGVSSTSYENHGPSIVTSILQFDCDNVFAMTCYCPSYLYSWKTRERHYDWPTTDIIDEVCELESHVVPVGYINSPLQFLEWRICYTKGEIRLIKSLPECLIKVYILMKAIVKVTLKPICKEISSYIIKNLVLWIAELNSVECFSENTLVTVLQHGFKFLKHCLVENNLPSYMIPERNLFAERLTLQQRSRLCMRIDCLHREGHRVVLRVKKVRDALSMLYHTPEEFRLFFERRQTIEILALLLNVYMKNRLHNEFVDMETFFINVMTDDMFIRIYKSILRLIPGLPVNFGEKLEEAIAIFRIDPGYVFRTIRESGEDFVIRNNPVIKYLS